MPEQLTYPGVYVREKPSGVRTITGVATSVTAFVGSAAQGPLQDPQLIESFADFVRSFGALAAKHRLGYAVQDYFRNGGGQAIVVRVANDDAAATQFDLSPAAAGGGANPNPPPNPPGLVLEARSPGAWADGLTVTVDHDTRPDANGQPLAGEFNLTVTGSDPDALPESLRNVSAEPAAARYVKRVLEAESRYLRAADGAKVEVARPDAGEFNSTTAGSDGAAIGADDLLGDAADGTGVYALAKADIFNLLVIPPPAEDTPTPLHVYRTALEFCRERRAVLLADAVLDDDTGAGTYLGDDWKAKAPQMIQAFGPGGKGAEYGAVYFPRLRRGVELVPSTPSVAGAIARNDTLRGIWKAPAGIEAQIDADGVAIALDDAGSGNLNPQGVNVVRTLPLYGTVIWGARTLAGSDQIGSEYKYLSVRRTALFIEETLFRALKWVVFEPNDEPLWGQIRLNVGVFMQGLFKQGAFQGTSPRDAYFVKCDKETTTQNDIDLGIVNVVVGFAPLKPAEFVVITIQQIAGQLQT